MIIIGNLSRSALSISSDQDVSNFINAANISDSNIIDSLTTLVTSLKSNQLYEKIKVFYPMVGNSGDSHKFNFINPEDSDDAYRLDFNGGVHSYNGWDSPDQNGYADTHFIMANELDIANCANTIVIGNNAALNSIAIGALAGGRFSMLISTGIRFAFRISTQRTFNNSDSRGIYTSQKISEALGNVWKNGVKEIANNAYDGVLPTVSLYLNAMNINGSAGNLDNKRIQSVFIHESFDDTQMTLFHSLIDEFENSLNRNTWKNE